jgi:hypothetical protein
MSAAPMARIHVQGDDIQSHKNQQLLIYLFIFMEKLENFQPAHPGTLSQKANIFK